MHSTSPLCKFLLTIHPHWVLFDHKSTPLCMSELIGQVNLKLNLDTGLTREETQALLQLAERHPAKSVDAVVLEAVRALLKSGPELMGSAA